MKLIVNLFRIAVLLLALPLAAYAQQIESKPAEYALSLTQYAYDSWDDRDGLPQNSVQAITQSRDGYLWLGTQQGLARFDGVRFEVFDGEDSPVLRRAYVWALAASRDGGIWMGSEEGGLVRHVNDMFTAYTKADGLPSNWVSALLEDRNGDVWIGMIDGGLAVRRDNRFIAIDSAAGFRGRNVFAIAADTGGIIWVAWGGGLARIKNDRAEAVRVSKKPAAVTALAARPGGGVYAGVAANGIAEVTNDAVRYIATPETGLPGTSFRDLAVAEDGAVFAGMMSGVARVYQGKVTTFPNSMPQRPTNVAAMHVDDEGSLWLGLDGGGLARMRKTPITPFGEIEGLASDMVYPIFEDRDGGMWVGTGGAGVNYIRDDQVTHYTAQRGQLTNNFIASFAQDREGAVWIGTFAGMTRIANGQSTHFGHADGLLGPFVRAIHFDPSGALWVGSHDGLQRFRPGPPRTFTTADGLADNFVMAIMTDRRGVLWVATRDGLSRYQNGRFRTYTAAHGLPEDGLMALHEDAEGTLWIAALSGLARLRNGRLEKFSTRDGLCADQLYSILEDDNGRLWLGGVKGIFSVEKQSIGSPRIKCTMYGRAAGMRAREANGAVNPPAARARDGRLWFGTIRGIAIIDPDNLDLDLAAPPVQIEQFVTQGKIYTQPPAKLPAGTRALEIRFAGLSFVAPEQMRFRYKLDGFDDEWVDAENRRVAYYTHLHPGRFTFRVQAANAEGEWNEVGAATAFTIAPLWWETWLFKGVLIFLAAGTLVGLYQLRTRGLKSRQQELLALAEQRGLAEARYRELFDNATDALFTTDAQGAITGINRKAAELTGYTPEEALRLNVRDLLPDSEAGERVARFWLSGAADGTERVNIICKDGGRVPVEVSTRAVEGNGVQTGIQAIARDVADRAALERQLRQSQKMEAVGQLAGGVAHDFNNLLTVIRGNGEMLLAELPEDDPARDDVEQINIAAERASALTRQLLTFSRKQVVHPRPLDLNLLLRDIEKMLQRLIGEDFTILTLPSVESAHVVADPGQLEQVLVNLVVNARDAMPKGGSITVTTSIMAVDDVPESPVRTSSGKAVVLCVTDTGMGMDAETQARIFEPFFTTKDPGKGTGLGLSTVYGIVQQAGGQIVCTSQLGRGTTFRIYLPFSEEAAVEAALDDKASFAVRGSETILLVEDEDPVRTLASRVLRLHGYQVIETRHGADALTASHEYPGHIDLLLSDVVMPAMNGRLLAEKLTQYRPDMRVLLMSGYTDDEILRRGLLAPGIAYLQKPFTPQVLTKVVRQVLDSTVEAGAGQV